MANFISANRYLSLDEMKINAKYIYDYLRGYGFSSNAICAMLGNMQTESTINPGIYENLDSSSSTNGLGLVQWTPNTVLKNWIDDNEFNYGYYDMDTQLERIVFEFANGLQYYPTDTYPMSGGSFVTSNESVEYLAQVFLINYERPKNQNQPNRSTQARYWYNFLVNGTDDPIIPPNPLSKNKKGFNFVLFNRKRRFKRI